MNRVVFCALGALVGALCASLAGASCSLSPTPYMSGSGAGAGHGAGGGGADDAGAGVPIVAEAIAVGKEHSCALLQDATVACWGRGDVGQLGDGMAGKAHLRETPVRIPGLSGVTAIRAGGNTTCAIVNATKGADAGDGG